MQKLNRFAKVNNEYSPGTNNGVPFTSTTATGSFTSFGPKWAAGTQFYDNLHNFFRTGFTQTHNLGLEFGTKNVGFRASGQYLNNSGVVPNNYYTKYSGRISNTLRGFFTSLSSPVMITTESPFLMLNFGLNLLLIFVCFTPTGGIGFYLYYNTSGARDMIFI